MARRAHSLQTLLNQIDARFPGRSTASDGWIGDEAHAARVSQHNPLPNGVVCAIDITEDLTVGLDCGRLMNELDASNDPRIFYLIHDRTIDNSNDSRSKYHGSNPHTTHLHISVRYTDPAKYDDARTWTLPMLTGTAAARPAPKPATGRPTLRRGAKGNTVALLQNTLSRRYPAYRHQHGALVVDGDFGPRTDAWVREFQRRSRLAVDGIVGPRTWKALRL